MDLSVIIPTFTRFDSLTAALRSVVAQQGVEIEVVVVDNASPGRISDRLQDFGGPVRSIRLPRNLFYCGAVNAGVRESTGRNVAVLNDDASVAPGWAARALGILEEHSEVGSVASRVMSAHDSTVIDSLGDGLSLSGLPFNRGWGRQLLRSDLEQREVFSAAGSCAVYRRADFDQAGGFDEHFVAYLDDIDLGFRLQLLGRKCVYEPSCLAFHEGGGTKKSRFRSSYLMERNRSWNLVKNLPTSVWQSASGEIRRSLTTPAPLVGGRSASAWAVGQLAAALRLPSVLRQRQTIQASRRVSDTYIESLLEPSFNGTCHL